MRTASLLLVALYCAASEAFVVSAGRLTAAPCRPRSAHPFTMKSEEDKEFEEWVRQKKLASGVDPDEDFGQSRRVANTITAVGGTSRALAHLARGAKEQGRRGLPRSCACASAHLACMVVVDTGLRMAFRRSDLLCWWRLHNRLLLAGVVTVVVPVILGIWAYNAGYLTPQ